MHVKVLMPLSKIKADMYLQSSHFPPRYKSDMVQLGKEFSVEARVLLYVYTPLSVPYLFQQLLFFVPL